MMMTMIMIMMTMIMIMMTMIMIMMTIVPAIFGIHHLCRGGVNRIND
jgi:hypothetical protein